MLLQEFMTLAVVHFVVIASPGPNIIASITNAVTHSVRAGVLTSLGVAIGNIFHIALGILGIAVLIDTYPEIGIFITSLGIAYLAYLGVVKIRTGLRQQNSISLLAASKVAENFVISGIVINITNVKAVIFFLMAFSTLIPISHSLGVKLFYGFWMASVNFLFLSSLAWLFGRGKLTKHKFTRESTLNIIGGAAYLIVAALLAHSTFKTFALSADNQITSRPITIAGAPIDADSASSGLIQTISEQDVILPLGQQFMCALGRCGNSAEQPYLFVVGQAADAEAALAAAVAIQSRLNEYEFTNEDMSNAEIRVVHPANSDTYFVTLGGLKQRWQVRNYQTETVKAVSRESASHTDGGTDPKAKLVDQLIVQGQLLPAIALLH